MAKLKKELGKHYLVEFIDCNPSKLKYVKDVKPILLKAVRISLATMIKPVFYQYKPVGVTGIVLIAESHFSIHTWPEHNYVTFDILTCGEMKPLTAINFLKRSFQAKICKTQIVARGF